MRPALAIKLIRKAFSNPEAVKLLTPYWREQNRKSGIPSTGFCYLGMECVLYAIGGIAKGLKPKYLKDDGETHWWLENESGIILDPTADQYGGDDIPYHKGIGAGLMNGYERPSRRAAILLEIAGIEVRHGRKPRLRQNRCSGRGYSSNKSSGSKVR